MSYLDKYLTRDTMYGDGIRDIRINNTKRKIASAFKDSPAYQEVFINSSVIPTGVWIVDNSDVKDTQNILSESSDAIETGDTVNWQHENWLIIIKDDKTDVYHKGTIAKCLGDLKWLNNDGFVKITPFTYRSDSSTNFGVQNGQIVDLGNERRQIIIQSNLDTKKIKKNKRFIIDERAWKVTAIDRIKKGIVNIALEEDEVSVSDNLDLGIADYTGNAANFSITILNGEHFSIRAGTSLQLTAEVKNNNNTVQKEVDWSVSDATIATVNKSGILTTIANGEVTVTAKLVDDPSIKDITVVTVQLENTDNFSIEIDKSPVVRVNQSITFTAVVKNNGVVDSTKTVQWYLYDTDGVSQPKAATMTFNSTTQCTIAGLSIGECKLKIVLIGSSTVQSITPIQVKTLI